MEPLADRRSDTGSSLVEVLIAVVILGIAVPGLLSGLAAVALTSGVHQGQADAHLAVVSGAEAVRDEARNPFDCAPMDYTPVAGVLLPSGWSSPANLRVTAAESGYWLDGGFQVASCSAATDLQRITLEASSPDGRAAEQLTVFKRRP